MARWKQKPEETYRFAVQSFFEPTDFLRTLNTGSSSTSRTVNAEVRPPPAPAQRDRQDRRALRGPGKEARTRLAYPRLRQDVHAAHRRSADPRAEGPLPKRDGDPRRRPHGARRAAQRLGREAAR
jgi:hypothetical protein